MTATTDAWEECTDECERSKDEERYLRRIDPKCWISAYYRRTGFGWMEWETAIVFIHDVEGRPLTWNDRDCLIIGGDRREELATMPKEQLRQWYADNINGNRNSMETILEATKEAAAPDVEKLRAYALALRTVQMPPIADQIIRAEVMLDVSHLLGVIERQAFKLEGGTL